MPGDAARPLLITQLARHHGRHMQKQASETGRPAGNSTRRTLATSTIATACCCQPCRPTTGRCFAPSPGRAQALGLPHLAASPGEALSLEAIQVALQRRLRLPLPIASGRCGPSPGCGGPVDLLGDHALACRERVCSFAEPKW